MLSVSCSLHNISKLSHGVMWTMAKMSDVMCWEGVGVLVNTKFMADGEER